MDLLELIHTRRSIRRYLDKPVSLEIVKESHKIDRYTEDMVHYNSVFDTSSLS